MGQTKRFPESRPRPRASLPALYPQKVLSREPGSARFLIIDEQKANLIEFAGHGPASGFARERRDSDGARLAKATTPFVPTKRLGRRGFLPPRPSGVLPAREETSQCAGHAGAGDGVEAVAEVVVRETGGCPTQALFFLACVGQLKNFFARRRLLRCGLGLHPAAE